MFLDLTQEFILVYFNSSVDSCPLGIKSLNMFIIVLLNSVFSKLLPWNTNIVGLMFFGGGAYCLGVFFVWGVFFKFHFNIACMFVMAAKVRLFVMYFNTKFQSTWPAVHGKVVGWAVLEESQGDGTDRNESLTRITWVSRGSTEGG